MFLPVAVVVTAGVGGFDSGGVVTVTVTVTAVVVVSVPSILVLYCADVVLVDVAHVVVGPGLVTAVVAVAAAVGIAGVIDDVVVIVAVIVIVVGVANSPLAS